MLINNLPQNASGLEHGLIEGPVSHSDIALAFLSGLISPCHVNGILKFKTARDHLGLEKKKHYYKVDRFTLAIDSFISDCCNNTGNAILYTMVTPIANLFKLNS